MDQSANGGAATSDPVAPNKATGSASGSGATQSAGGASAPLGDPAIQALITQIRALLTQLESGSSGKGGTSSSYGYDPFSATNPHVTPAGGHGACGAMQSAALTPKYTV